MVLERRLDWDDTFEIVKALQRQHPQVDFEELSLGTLLEWIVALPEFGGDQSLVNDDILIQIFNEWFEEMNL
ncbi:MAG: Fe-S cluster assembly protein IscX [Anaerolineales bacterium]|nr:Fe-S cluster assembly protein IscX [Anaerolineales bacterium]MCS7248506.1 Fe-S cluster assembly protein IscX [Anaerolineales bacterium]MDW8162319.1 Fe-S cluster assembly protein IscX [Anaerolineales bacterium]MDW8447955.1 Fe-S cluster assembly protein IscX [Anaerolineales bacterium]